VYRSPKYPTPPAQAEAFVQSMRHGTLIAAVPGGHPQVSLLPFVKVGDQIEMHLVQADPTFAAVQAGGLVTFLVSDFLAFTPHDFVDEDDPGKATLHFRAVAFECEVEVCSTDPAAVHGALTRLLAHHEPEADPPPVASDDARLQMLGTVRLRVLKTHAKFKAGPAAPVEVKRQVTRRLRERDQPGDRRAADVIESYLKG
jgi:predicted FMN-binding regulatory protein PaiB